MSFVIPTYATAIVASPDSIRPVIVVMPCRRRTPTLVLLRSIEGLCIWHFNSICITTQGVGCTCACCTWFYLLVLCVICRGDEFDTLLEFPQLNLWVCLICHSLCTHVYLSILLDCNWELRLRYRGATANIRCWTLVLNDGNLIRDSEGLDKGIKTILTVLFYRYDTLDLRPFYRILTMPHLGKL